MSEPNDSKLRAKVAAFRDEMVASLDLNRWEMPGQEGSSVDDDYYTALKYVIGKLTEILSDSK